MASSASTINLRRIGCRIAAAAVLAAVLGGDGAAAEYATGAARYAVSLDPGSTALAFSSASGSRSIVFTRDCDTYTLTDELSVTVSIEDKEVTLRFAGRYVESAERLVFDTGSTVGDKTVQRSKGVATRGADGITVVLSEPTPRTVTIPGKVLFPIATGIKSLAAAGRGETIGTYRAFNGEGAGDKSTEISILNLPAPPPSDDEIRILKAAGADFSGLRRWRQKVTYFSGDADQSARSTYETIIYENGFEAGGILSVAGIGIALTLAEVKLIPPTPCAAK